ncbi:MAG: PilT protein domain protein [Frankiales bacterium]|nr:PilT protein domain protein [Frankiales bacterium]MCW2707470.1 PilT protein domain protein [Frankiales bacterium]
MSASGVPPGSGSSPPRRRAVRAPTFVLEVLRFLVVVFFAGAGYQVGSGVSSSTKVLGALNGTAVGLILGSGLGYVLGGILGRTTASSAQSARTRLHETSAEELIAGGMGAIGGVLLGAGVAWPVFLLRQAYLSFPLFAFVCVTLAYVGYLVGASKRSGLLAMFGQQAGLAPREAPASTRPRVLDTSVAIDGRIVDVVRSGFLHGTFWVPTPVLGELQRFADSAEDARRSKGRRGLEVLETLKREPGVEVEVVEVDVPAVPEVDGKLVRICLDTGAALLTLDTNLAKVAALAGVRVLNLHGLALALRPPVQAGEDVSVHLLKPGKEAGQAVGYLDDGTMVVVEQGRGQIGNDVTVQVASVVVTANGRLVFGKLPGDTGRPARRRTPGPPVPAPSPRS